MCSGSHAEQDYIRNLENNGKHMSSIGKCNFSQYDPTNRHQTHNPSGHYYASGSPCGNNSLKPPHGLSCGGQSVAVHTNYVCPSYRYKATIHKFANIFDNDHSGQNYIESREKQHGIDPRDLSKYWMDARDTGAFGEGMYRKKDGTNREILSLGEEISQPICGTNCNKSHGFVSTSYVKSECPGPSTNTYCPPDNNNYGQYGF
jgi:hypothetical protein